MILPWLLTYLKLLMTQGADAMLLLQVRGWGRGQNHRMSKQGDGDKRLQAGSCSHAFQTSVFIGVMETQFSLDFSFLF